MAKKVKIDPPEVVYGLTLPDEYGPPGAHYTSLAADPAKFLGDKRLVVLNKYVLAGTVTVKMVLEEE